LLAEHAGGRADPDLCGALVRSDGLVDYLDELASAQRGRLRRLSRRTVLENRAWLAHLEHLGFSLDPATPVFEKIF
jgi:hypothetical protein